MKNRSFTWQYWATPLLATFTMLTLTGCAIGGNLGDVWYNAKSFSPLAILVLVINIYFMVKIFESNRGMGSKILWFVVLWFLPVVGALAYYFFAHEPTPKKA
ncbi:MAG: PLDc N-terminal domain-containing protein [Bacteroidetes Order II. Incertae sedis bacterium]|nr:PLDc N-terminal domain-containing protein [Bacteroidetes Order II. bacterium]